jgi:hypothetical protein
MPKENNKNFKEKSVVKRDSGEVVSQKKSDSVIHSYTAGYTEGNAFTGEQFTITRDYDLDHPLTSEEAKG